MAADPGSPSAAPPKDRIRELVIARLRAHLSAIASQDWDYFAALRYRTEAQQAVSDLERLVRLYEKELDELRA